jgi:hypothetical protein
MIAPIAIFIVVKAEGVVNAANGAHRLIVTDYYVFIFLDLKKSHHHELFALTFWGVFY